MARSCEIFMTSDEDREGGLISGEMNEDMQRAEGEKAAAHFAQGKTRVLGSRDASSARYPES